jgi:hypothetical protein
MATKIKKKAASFETALFIKENGFYCFMIFWVSPEKSAIITSVMSFVLPLSLF